MKSILNYKLRAYIYFLTFSVIFFGQNYCTNICPYIDGLTNIELTRNLFIIAIVHLIVREILYKIYQKPFKGLSITRHAYFLSVISWIIAGVFASVLHIVLYPNFPIGSHLKLLSSYLVIGGAIIAQLEYLLFEHFYYQKNSYQSYETQEKLYNRITESLLIFALAPAIMVFMIVSRYSLEGLIDNKVSYEILMVQLFFILSIIIVAVIYRKYLLIKTIHIKKTIQEVKNGNYQLENPLNSPDEFGEISHALVFMAQEIEKNIKKNNSLNQQVIDVQKEIIYNMSAIVENRSKETGNHIKRVAEYSKILALNLGICESEAELLKLASPMHDIGKVGIADAILKKPSGFTQDEFEIMKTHAKLGYEMLKTSKTDIIKIASIVAHEHHEKWDGSGYPRGLKRDDIHIYGRITAVADVFDALGSSRIYKKAWPDEKVFKLLKEEAGKHFDPNVIKVFFENIDQILQIRDKYVDKQ